MQMSLSAPVPLPNRVLQRTLRWFGVDAVGDLKTYERIGGDIWALVLGTRWAGLGAP